MSKDTARQEVEKVCFAYEKAGKTGNKKDWGKFYDLEEPLIKKVEFANQPKLSIPKKIAEELDKVPFHNPIAQLSNKDCDLTDFNDTVKRYAWNNKENGYICVAYLAGKALGVELVEVTDA
ncbi:hypothetical protein [Lactococcus garvieae]|uniref:Phage protein n=1 Tax=Lactococcus garvieae TaxID=1363 RepID=A0A1I4I542_9LACT|nr:hypothetical protein [Lactococcus garvieae]SFL49562.1 hypothetical protein SAMN05216438_11323 [Lactococcus garvieae]